MEFDKEMDEAAAKIQKHYKKKIMNRAQKDEKSDHSN